MRWYIDKNKFYKHVGYYMIVPCISIWYNKYRFLETGVYTPAFGVNLGWLNFRYALAVQQTY